jgi:hypothetical protein
MRKIYDHEIARETRIRDMLVATVLCVNYPALSLVSISGFP